MVICDPAHAASVATISALMLIAKAAFNPSLSFSLSLNLTFYFNDVAVYSQGRETRQLKKKKQGHAIRWGVTHQYLCCFFYFSAGRVPFEHESKKSAPHLLCVS